MDSRHFNPLSSQHCFGLPCPCSARWISSSTEHCTQTGTDEWSHPTYFLKRHCWGAWMVDCPPHGPRCRRPFRALVSSQELGAAALPGCCRYSRPHLGGANGASFRRGRKKLAKWAQHLRLSYQKHTRSYKPSLILCVAVIL